MAIGAERERLSHLELARLMACGGCHLAPRQVVVRGAKALAQHASSQGQPGIWVGTGPVVACEGQCFLWVPGNAWHGTCTVLGSHTASGLSCKLPLASFRVWTLCRESTI